MWDGTLLVGGPRPLQLSVSRYRERERDPAFVRALAWAGFGGLDDLLGRHTAGPDELRAFLGEWPILTDDRPLVEYFRALPSREPGIDVTGLRGDVRRHLIE